MKNEYMWCDYCRKPVHRRKVYHLFIDGELYLCHWAMGDYEPCPNVVPFEEHFCHSKCPCKYYERKESNDPKSKPTPSVRNRG